MNVFIENDSLFFNEISYIFSIFCRNKDIKYILTQNSSNADLIISTDEKSDIRISKDFFIKLNNKVFNHTVHFKNDCRITDESGFMDLLSTAFYVLCGIQEFDYPEVDQYGRFRFIDSFQKRFNNVNENIVQEIFDQLFDSLSKFKLLKKNRNQSKIFLSHDIDTIYGSIIQDSFFNLKKLRPDLILKVLFSNLFLKPSWLNMDRIMKIESEYDFYSTFYWLVNKGKVSEYLNNSDYDINNKAVRKYINEIKETKWENGLHKSASTDSFQDEIKKLGVSVKGNRYHYLKFNPQNDFQKIENAGILFDTSLGFVEECGFRNGYGQPYRPYNFIERRKFNFVECPLNVMDTTFFNYKKVSSIEFVKSVIAFCEKNKYDSILSVLFHNNYISDFKYNEYFKSFKSLLNYFYESGFKCITQTEIINQYLDEH